MEKHEIHPQLLSLKLPIENLSLLEGNPRKGSVDAVVRSYQAFGQRKPIVARKTGEGSSGVTGSVLAGNHQLEAALRLGWTHIAVVLVEDDAITASAFAIADNRVSDLGEYDAEELAAVLEAMRATPELLAAASYDPADLGEAVQAQRDSDEAAKKTMENSKKKKTLDDLAEKYAERTTRTLLVELPQKMHLWVLNELASYKESNQLHTNGDALILLLKQVTEQRESTK